MKFTLFFFYEAVQVMRLIHLRVFPLFQTDSVPTLHLVCAMRNPLGARPKVRKWRRFLKPWAGTSLDQFHGEESLNSLRIISAKVLIRLQTTGDLRLIPLVKVCWKLLQATFSLQQVVHLEVRFNTSVHVFRAGSFICSASGLFTGALVFRSHWEKSRRFHFCLLLLMSCFLRVQLPRAAACFSGEFGVCAF